MEEVKKQPTKLRKVYSFCRNLIALVLTLVALVPIIYLLGSDDSHFPTRPLFAAYSEDAYFQARVAEIEAALNSSLVVNLHTQGSDKKEDSVKNWEHLQEFVRYLGFHFNRNQLATVSRLIVPPEVRQKKGKTQSPQSQQQVEKAYALSSSGQINALRNKLNKVALNTMNRLKIKQKQVKNGGFAQTIRGRIVDEVSGRKIWIITIHPDNWQSHSAEALRKQLTLLSKEREKDRFVVVSIAAADSEWKRMKAIPISINESVFSSIKTKLKQIVKVSLPFEINSTRLIQAVLCQYDASLFKLNNFLQNCNSTYSCYNSIKLLSAKNKKQQNTQVMELLNELCSKGHIDEDDHEFQVALNQLGFYNEQEEAEDSIKLYFDIANGKKCKGSKQCTFEWLKSEPKTKSPKANHTQSTQAPQTPRQFKPAQPKQPIKQSNKSKTTIQQPPKKVVVADQNKTKPLKVKADKKVSKQQIKTISKNKDQKASSKSKQKQDAKSEKPKEKPKKPKQAKPAKEQKVQQYPQLPCNQDLQIDQTITADIPKDTYSQSAAINEPTLQAVEAKVEGEIGASHEVAVCAEADQSCEAAKAEESKEETVEPAPAEQIITSEPQTPSSEQPQQAQATQTVTDIETSSQPAQPNTTQSDTQDKVVESEAKQQTKESQNQQAGKQQSSESDNAEQAQEPVEQVEDIQAVVDSNEDQGQDNNDGNDEQAEETDPEQVVADVQANQATQTTQQVKEQENGVVEVEPSQPAEPIQSSPTSEEVKDQEDNAPQAPTIAEDIAQVVEESNEPVEETNQTPNESNDVIE